MPHGLAPFSSIRTPESKGVGNASTTRPSSSANFFVDSLDKTAGQGSGDFIINKQQSLFNGFFNRIAVSEVVLDWGIPNIAAYWGNHTFSVTISGGITTPGTYVATLGDGFYDVFDALNALIVELNILVGIPGVFAIAFTPGGSSAELQIDQSVSAGGVFTINSTPLARSLFSSSQIGLSPINLYFVESPLILGTRYIDIVSQQLTYNQDLKDSTTATVVRDVLYRWYFAHDNVPVPVDLFNFPINQGYLPFVLRRAIPYPKQIRWNPAQPIGQVSFQVYDDQGRIIDTNNYAPSANFQFQMSMLLSED